MIIHERDGWWLTLDGKRRLLDHEPERDGDWLICASNGEVVRVHASLTIKDHWAWTWIVGGMVIAALAAYLLVYVIRDVLRWN